MIEVIANAYMVDANAANDVVDVLDHIVCCRWPEQLANGSSECRPLGKIIDLPIELERIIVFFGYSSSYPQGYQFLYKSGLRDIDKITFERSDMYYAAVLANAINLFIAKIASHV